MRINFGRELEIIDVPGFGFMYGVEAEKQEKMKTKIIKYLEKNKDEILFAVEVLDLKMFPELAQRWKERGYIPLDVEWYYFLEELDLKPIVIANKIDKISPFELEDYLNNLVFELGLSGHWKELSDVIIPFSAKTGKGFKELRKAIHRRLEELGELGLMKFIRKKFY